MSVRVLHPFQALRLHLSAKVAAATTAVAVLVLIAAGGASLHVFAASQMASITALQQSRADAAASSIQHFIDDIEAQLRRLIDPSWSSSGDDDRRVDATRALRALTAAATIRLLDPQGLEQLRVSRLGPDVARTGVDLGKSEAYLVARQRGRHIGPIYFQEGSEPYVTIHVAGTSARQGSIVADVNLKLIWDLVTALRIGEAGRAFVIDSQGRLISHPDISVVLRRADVSSLPHVKAALAGPRPDGAGSLVSGRSLEGQDILSSHSFLPGLGWSIVTELPRSEALAPLHAAVQWSAIALLCGVAAAVASGILIARRVIGPIEILAAGAARIGAGDLEHRISVSGSDELAHLGKRFNDMAASLQTERASLEDKVRSRTKELVQAIQAKSRFLASASHDLRQPLHALSLFVDELASGPTEERRLRLNGNLAKAVASLNDMFDAILDTSKIEAGAIRPSLAHFPLGPVLDQLRQAFGPVAQAKGLALDVDDSTVWVTSDRLLLHRILQNLLSNAIRYTASGNVSLECAEATGAVTIAVRDTGPGIPSELQPEIFNEFFRASTPGQTGERGLGLGLFIVESFARLLGHPLSVSSQPGIGSSFEILVPISSPPIGTQAAALDTGSDAGPMPSAYPTSGSRHP